MQWADDSCDSIEYEVMDTEQTGEKLEVKGSFFPTGIGNSHFVQSVSTQTPRGSIFYLSSKVASMFSDNF